MKYKLTARANPQDRDTAPKYYVVPVYAGTMDLRRISKDVADLSSLSPGDVYNVLVNFI